MAQPIPLDRATLAKFLPDPESIRRFEEAFARIQEGVSEYAALFSAVGSADARAAAAYALAAAAVSRQEPAYAPAFAGIMDFPSGAVSASQPRRLKWDANVGSLQIGLAPGVDGDICQQLDFYVKNTGGSTISKGQSVMATGTVGASGKITVAKATANGSIPGHYMMGIAAHDIPNNEFGYVVHFGMVRGMDASGSTYSETWADGDLLYFSPTTVGGLTKVVPAAPAISVPIAIVIHAVSGGSGSLFVRMDIDQNMGARSTKGVDTTDDVIIDLATKGLVLKDTQATPHYWRVTISNVGGLVTTDLGTTKP